MKTTGNSNCHSAGYKSLGYLKYFQIKMKEKEGRPSAQGSYSRRNRNTKLFEQEIERKCRMINSAVENGFT